MHIFVLLLMTVIPANSLRIAFRIPNVGTNVSRAYRVSDVNTTISKRRIGMLADSTALPSLLTSDVVVGYLMV